MKNFEEKDYKIFDLFHNRWAALTAGSMDHFNSCTIGWGSMGTLWTRHGEGGPIITVYVHPSRYTCDFMKENGQFTVCFFPQEYRKDLGIIGTLSGRDTDKIRETRLTPVAMGNSVGFREAELTFLCRKIYQHPFAKEDLAPEIGDYYRNNPKSFPVDENGDWQPHWMFVGEILEVEDRRDR